MVTLPKKIIKKSVIVHAIRWTGDNQDFVAAFMGFDDERHLTVTAERSLLINTMEGTMVCRLGNWIIEGVRKEYYPIHHDILCETYLFADDIT